MTSKENTKELYESDDHISVNDVQRTKRTKWLVNENFDSQ